MVNKDINRNTTVNFLKINSLVVCKLQVTKELIEIFLFKNIACY